MYDPKVIELLNRLEQQALAVQASIETMKALVEGENVWSAEEEAQYRLRHSQ